MNIFSLLGACAMACISTSNSIGLKAPKRSLVNQTIEGSYLYYYEDTGEYLYYLNIYADTDFQSYYSNSSIFSYNLNYFYRVLYYDSVNNTFASYFDMSTSGSSKSFANCMNDSYASIGGGINFGIAYRFSVNNTNPAQCVLEMAYIGSYLNSSTYTLAGDTSLAQLGLVNNFGLYPIDTAIGNNSVTKGAYLMYTSTFNTYNNSDFSLTEYQKTITHDSQTISYLPLGGCYTEMAMAVSNFNTIKNQTLIFDFLRSGNLAYSQGYDSGLQDGISQGYQNGYTAGYEEADNQDSVALSIVSGIINVGLLPVNIFLQILNFEVFGINIGGLVTSFMTIAIIIILWRIIKGSGKND